MRTRVTALPADSLHYARHAAKMARRLLAVAIAAEWKDANIACLRSIVKRADGAVRHRERIART